MEPASARERIDPQMRPQLDALLSLLGPRGFQEIEDLRARRERYEEVMTLAAGRAPDESRVARQDVTVRPPSAGDDLTVRVYRPAGLVGSAPGVVYIHGGGMVMGSVAADDGFAATLSEDVGCVVASVGYGLAPENPGPGPVEDCYLALLWLHEHADDLDLDRSRLALFGSSAGGGLACGVALLARDRSGPRLSCQVLVYPMLDDRTALSDGGPSDLGIWDHEANAEAWSHLLGESLGTDGVSPYVAPARATSLVGLPPTYIEVGELDLFLDEDLRLARRLADSGVPVTLHEVPGACHGFDQLAPSSDAARAARSDRANFLRRCLTTLQHTTREVGD